MKNKTKLERYVIPITIFAIIMLVLFTQITIAWLSNKDDNLEKETTQVECKDHENNLMVGVTCFKEQIINQKMHQTYLILQAALMAIAFLIIFTGVCFIFSHAFISG